MDDIKRELLLLWTKWWLTIVSIGVGVIGKFSYDMVSGKKFSKAAFFGSLGICIFIGYVTAVICNNRGWHDTSAWLVPVSTALSQNLMQGLIQNWDKIFKKIFGITINKENEEK